jgi:hypothetical protein
MLVVRLQVGKDACSVAQRPERVGTHVQAVDRAEILAILANTINIERRPRTDVGRLRFEQIGHLTDQRGAQSLQNGVAVARAPLVGFREARLLTSATGPPAVTRQGTHARRNGKTVAEKQAWDAETASGEQGGRRHIENQQLRLQQFPQATPGHRHRQQTFGMEKAESVECLGEVEVWWQTEHRGEPHRSLQELDPMRTEHRLGARNISQDQHRPMPSLPELQRNRQVARNMSKSCPQFPVQYNRGHPASALPGKRNGRQDARQVRPDATKAPSRDADSRRSG